MRYTWIARKLFNSVKKKPKKPFLVRLCVELTYSRPFLTRQPTGRCVVLVAFYFDMQHKNNDFVGTNLKTTTV